jgi:hypothetical protein
MNETTDNNENTTVNLDGIEIFSLAEFLHDLEGDLFAYDSDLVLNKQRALARVMADNGRLTKELASRMLGAETAAIINSIRQIEEAKLLEILDIPADSLLRLPKEFVEEVRASAEHFTESMARAGCPIT